MIKKLTFSLLSVAFLISIGACNATPDAATDATTTDSSESSADAPGAGVTVRPSNSDWSEEQFLTEVVNIGLKRLGYTVEDIQQADYAALNVSMANGDLDFSTGFYEPNHEDFFKNAGGDEKLERIGEIILGGGVQGLLIDKKTADEYGLSQMEQLQDPEIAKIFDTDGDGKANLAGCQTGWACSEIIDHQIGAFGLKDTVQQDQGSYAALIADVITRYSEGQSVLYFAYAPHWLLAELKPGEDVVWLEAPFTDLPGELAGLPESKTTVDGKNLGFPVLKQRIVASQAFVDENPVATRLFEVVSIPLDDVNTESALIQSGENSLEEIRRHAEEWVDNNPDLFESWLEEARQAAG